MQNIDDLPKDKIIELLSQGTYGCVYRPGLTCKGKISSLKYITKIQNMENESKKETAIGVKIKKIKNFSNHFAPILSSCPISLGQIGTDEIDKCDIIDDRTKKYASNRIKYVGDNTLGKFIFNVFHENTKAFFRTILESYFDLIKSVSLLYDNGILHMDLKENNIMVDNVSNKPIIIDFGLSIDKSLVKPEMYKDIFFPNGYDYYPWCFDISVISYIVHEAKGDLNREIATMETFDKLCDNFINLNTLFALDANQYNTFSSSEKIDFKKRLLVFFKQFDGAPWINVLNEFLKYDSTWDIYAINVTYLQLLDEVFINDYNNPEYPFAKKMIDTFKTEILALPNERKHAVDLHQLFFSTFSVTERKQFNKLLHVMVDDSKKPALFNEKKKIVAENKIADKKKENEIYRHI